MAHMRASIFVKGESMMKRPSVIMATILTASILFSGLAFGAELPAGPSHEPGSSMVPPPPHCGPHEFPMPGGMRLLLTCQQINVLSELTGLTQENVRQLLISSPPPAILEAYGVPFDDFITAMDKQSVKLIKQAAVAGLITKKQEEDILKRMTQRPSGLRPMKNHE
jgi:hypothetical protein